MIGMHLRLYTYEIRRHDGQLVYQWLLDQAKRFGIHGGSAFRAMAGFGRHGRLHEARFFELAGEEPVLVEFVLTDAQATQLFDLLDAEGLHLFYTKLPIEYGVIGHSDS